MPITPKTGSLFHAYSHGDAEHVGEVRMRPRLPRCLSVALAACVLLFEAAQAQVMPFGGNFGPGLSPEDNRLLFESVVRLNAAKPSRVRCSEAWSNRQTQTSGTSTILRVFRSGGMACHLVRHYIVVVGQAPAPDYQLTWCRASTGLDAKPTWRFASAGSNRSR